LGLFRFKTLHSVLQSGRSNRFLFCTNYPDRFWGPASLLFI